MEPSTWSLPKILGMLGRAITNAHPAYLAETGLTPAAYRILETLAAGQLAQVELARAVLVEAQTMGCSPARLERDGLGSGYDVRVQEGLDPLLASSILRK